MARFNWKRSIETLANEVEGCLMAAHEIGPKFDHNLRAEAGRKAAYAAWLAKSYNRKGVRRNEHIP